MNKRIALLFSLFICSCAFAATSTLTFTGRCNGSATADDGVVWSITSNGPEAKFDSEKGIHFGTTNSGEEVSRITLTTNGILGTITQVKVNASGNRAKNAYVQVSVGGAQLLCDNYYLAPLFSDPDERIFTGSSSGDIRVYITQDYARSPLYCKSIEVTYTSDLVVQDGKTKVISSTQSLGNLTIEEGGKIILSDKKLTVDSDFVIKTTMGSGKSGQLVGATESNFEVKGNTYIDITLGDEANAAKWHAFTVPFPVDALHGIYDVDGTQLTNEVHYAIMDYHGDVRADGQYGWKKFTGTMTPGTFYLMTVDGARTTYRMKATGDLISAASKDFQYYTGSGATSDFGWNGLGNPTLEYHKVGYPVQVLNPSTYVFETKLANACNLVVGTPFFYQASEDGSMAMLTADAAAYYAPQHTNTAESTHATIAFGNDEYTDYLYLSASEEASDSYEIGKDLAKMTMTSQPTVAQIAGVAYGTSLCMLHTPLSNDQSKCALSLYAPANGTYTIAAQDQTDAHVYLTKDGVIVQDITSQAAQLELTKGENNQYGLILAAKNSTSIDETEGLESSTTQKIIIDNQLFILRADKVYDATGRKIRK